MSNQQQQLTGIELGKQQAVCKLYIYYIDINIFVDMINNIQSCKYSIVVIATTLCYCIISLHQQQNKLTYIHKYM